MASRTPPRSSVDRDRIDIRGTPTPCRTRPSYIPLPGSISASPSAASTLLPSASNSNLNSGMGNGVVRSGSALQYHRPSETSIGRASLDDPRTTRSTSLSATARTSSPGPGAHILPPSSSLLRSSLVGISEHHHSIAAPSGMPYQRTHSRTNSTANSEGRSRSSSRNAPGSADVFAAAEYNGYSTSNGTQSTIVADDCDDGERVLPVRVAVRVRPLLVGSGSPADSAVAGAINSRHMQPRSNLANCLEVLPNATIVVSPAAFAAPGNSGTALSAQGGSLSYHGASGSIGDDVFGLARHSINNGSMLGGAASSSSSGLLSSANGITSTTSSAPRTFKFDHAFGPEAQQASVYEAAISPLLSRFVEGYNVTVLAYGQTSSGKTYTMGTDADDVSLLSQGDAVSEATGIVPRSLGWLFSWAAQQQSSPNSVSDSGSRPPSAAQQAVQQGVDIRVSFLEVYNEELIDLVALTQYRGVRPPIFVREDTKGNIIWTGVKEMPVSDARGALDILISGSQERQTGGTKMNEKSSRSHAIYSIILTQTRMRTRSGSVAADGTVSTVREPVKIVSKLHFVDLAGSERLKKTMAVGERQREGISINSGLLALGNVISALGDTQRGSLSFVPYRDSKLTHMLRDSLGGNAQTLLIACVSAAEANLTETVNTLKYAARARNIKNRGGVNMVTMGRVSAKEVESLRALVRKLKGEVRMLKEKMQALDVSSRDSMLGGSAASLPMLGQPATTTNGNGLSSRLSFIGSSQTPRSVNGGDPAMPDTPSKIPTMSVALQKRAQTAEELNHLKARNLTLESELELLNDTYTELLLKFNDACREIEEKQSEGFQRDQKLRDREQEIRRLTAHSRHERRVVSSVAESIDGASSIMSGGGSMRPTSVADTLRMKRRSTRMSRSISELEKSDAASDRVQSIAEEDDAAPPMPDMTRLRDLRSASAVSSARTSQINTSSAAGSLINVDAVVGSDKLTAALGGESIVGPPGEAEFDAILEEYDASVRALEEELKTAREAVEGLKLQLSMQETKATFAEKLNTSQLAQIETMREQLAKAREAGLEEEERRRAVEAELEEANFNAETHLESVINEWRLEMQHVDEQWAERWEAAQIEHQKEITEQREEINRLRNSIKDNSAGTAKSVQLMSPPPTAHDIQSEKKYQQPQQQYSAEREENERLSARIHQLEETLDNSVSRAHSLETEVEILTARSLDAEARASSAEDALSALSAKMSSGAKDESSSGFGSGPLSPPILPSYSRSFSDLPRRTSDKIMLCARNSMAMKNDTGANSETASAFSPEPTSTTSNGVSSSEQRLRNMRGHRYSTAVPVNAASTDMAHIDASADKYASYPELRLASSHQNTREYGFGPNGRPLPIYDEDQIQKMLQDAVAEVDKEAWYEKDRTQMLATVELLKETKKSLQERNSQLQNLLRDLGDRLVGLAEENDQLEVKANERDSLMQEINRLTGVVSSHERTIRDLQREARSHAAKSADQYHQQKQQQKQQQQQDTEKKQSRPQSMIVPRHTSTETSKASTAVRESAPPSLEQLNEVLSGGGGGSGSSGDNDATSYELGQLQSRLSMVEAELTEALLASNEHQSNAEMLMQQVDEYRVRIKDVETDVESLMVELDAKTKENQQLSMVLQKQKKDADAEIESHKKLASVLRESLVASEQHMDEAKLASDRYTNELVRVQAEVKKLEEQLDSLRQQLEDSQGISMSEARDRDIWKSRCQDLREEIEELRARRRQSKILCF
ncbi:hypothetical protein IW140_004101 [Coemansia sp. RSA 1813]|nr:hypothetical protein LPJ74_001698 [Coemansia sp. RSA 1843]KAJ2088341.1 hypothetical protein IW138_004318 [Coemansia sp. RSA 986]KAJ2213321.1 hypothetical protein EV179_003919 [Coemansia sp. RSA 487]KAJ2568195.1 hypothetical protein IW140_004101 [Coemansia sp. RSA 1813]